MRVPKNKPLEVFIRELMDKGLLYLFYQTRDWLDLREEVLRDNHYECLWCADKGKYTKANTVHHVNHVTKHPELALSRYYVDKHGRKRDNLIPLCKACHNVAHPEKRRGRNGKAKVWDDEVFYTGE